ncbi:hypothetical protein LG943_26465 [Streptomonospora sp. S1-112]|uniref:DUF305 domain-containing protein n=1 Tax=Streptomonospora mangrovi TaxID=2883123 RepID=A0A9X3SJX3_9ACTN|nr:hypothetical protein [Streptomonospora mangrovi]MDA0567839.1 hypothetical protein [Streptomonospora mangrovi]
MGSSGAVTRRTVVVGALAGVAATALAGCQGPRWYPSDISPDEYVLRSVITEKERMIARYEATVAAGDGPMDLLERLLDDHRAHVEALRVRLPEEPGRTPEDSAPSPGPSPEPVPETPLGVGELRVAEQSAAESRGRQVERLTDSGLAQLLAAVGACEAGHTRLLAEAR